LKAVSDDGDVQGGAETTTRKHGTNEENGAGKGNKK
jgi:hypothetical protein